MNIYENKGRMPHHHGIKANNGGLPQLGDLSLTCNMLRYLFVIYILTKSPILCSRAPFTTQSFIHSDYVCAASPVSCSRPCGTFVSFSCGSMRSGSLKLPCGCCHIHIMREFGPGALNNRTGAVHSRDEMITPGRKVFDPCDTNY